jgi:glycosyltransferase involved in cell wall biosynthesis
MNKKRILYIQYTNPAAYPPLEHSSCILADSGWEVLFLGTHIAGLDALIFYPNEWIKVRMLPRSQPGWRLKLHYLWYCLWVLLWAVIWRPQWVYASDVLSTPVALLLKVILGKRVIYHEHDAPDAATATTFIRLCLITRRWLAQRSDSNILPNQERIRLFCLENSAAENKCMCVWNCPSTKEVRPSKTETIDGDFWLLFQGSVVPARLPITVLHALSKLPSQVKLRIIGYETIGHKGYVEILKAEALRLNISERVDFLGTIAARHELLSWTKTSSVGISFMPRHTSDVNMKFMTGASNKPFEYLACGLPLLVSDLAEWQIFFVNSGCALPCNPDDPESIAAALRWYLEHPNETREMGENGRQRILSEWNYEKQFEPVVNLLSGTTK